MLDQRYSAENFRRIYDIENRRGSNLDRRFFPDLVAHTDTIRALRQTIRTLKSAGISTPAEQAALAQARDDHDVAKQAKDTAIDGVLADLATEIRARGYRLNVNRVPGPGNKSLYPTDPTAAAYFILKQLQFNLHRLYKIKPADRTQICASVRDVLASELHLEIVRTDVSDFYESIDRGRLMRKIEDDQLLGLQSKRFLAQIFSSYETASNAAVGLPRGVAVSAYLSELYMRRFDDRVAKLPGLLLYHRYVDDIIAVFARPPSGFTENYLTVLSALAGEQGLSLNPTKTSHLASGSKPVRFNYLGYRYERTPGDCTMRPSGRKIAKYRARVRAVFEVYRRTRSQRGRKADRLLATRLRYLTGNTRLANSKSHAAVGVYYNNSLATDISSFQSLDLMLQRLISTLPSASLRSRLTPLSFSRGFNARHFHPFSTREIATIVKGWSNVA